MLALFSAGMVVLASVANAEHYKHGPTFGWRGGRGSAYSSSRPHIIHTSPKSSTDKDHRSRLRRNNNVARRTPEPATTASSRLARHGHDRRPHPTHHRQHERKGVCRLRRRAGPLVRVCELSEVSVESEDGEAVYAGWEGQFEDDL